MLHHIIVAVDGSPYSDRAVRSAGELAVLAGAKLTVLHVIESVEHYPVPRSLSAYAELEHVSITPGDLAQKAAADVLAHAEARLRGLDVQAELSTTVGHPVKAIIERAQDVKADLIVMGSRGLSDLKGLLVGSVSHKVTQLAECSVLIVK